MVHGTPATERYTVTYAFDEDSGGACPKPIERIRETVGAMQRDELLIAFLGAIQVVDEAGRSRRVTARFEASSKGMIGLLNWLGGLPACGSPQLIDPETFGTDGVDAGVAGVIGS